MKPKHNSAWPIPITSRTMPPPESLRSHHDLNRIRIAAWNVIGISDHLHRNQQQTVEVKKLGRYNVGFPPTPISHSHYTSLVDRLVRFKSHGRMPAIFK